MTLDDIRSWMEKNMFSESNAEDKDNQLLCMTLTDRLIRGQIIGTFSIIEALMDDLINRLTPDLLQERMSMDKKKATFKKAIEKYEANFNKDLSELKLKMDNVIEKRHNAAHWYLDTSDDGRKLYLDKRKIRLINAAKNTQYVLFDKDTYKDYELNILSMQTTLVSMQHTIINSNN